ncbi:MAG TPA: hypothetical protein PK788_08225 [Gemmatimonadaceae bacterium]|nr:hypothetical protein [Gemmatimonadaceae bacterium]HRQ77267.1 hypothetical protein [Gemmatimonadaceae bacterium]
MRSASLALLVATAFPLAPSAAQAQGATPRPAPTVAAPPAAPTPIHRFGWVLEGGVEYGGEVLVTLLFDDGSEQEILAGQGGSVAFGVDYRSSRVPQLGLRATAGVKFTTNASSNADISFVRVPLEVVGSYHFAKDWRAGAGLAYHTGVRFDGDDFVPDVDFDPAAGATIELGWKAFALTYTAIEYTANGGSIDASSFGLSATWVFGKRY